MRRQEIRRNEPPITAPMAARYCRVCVDWIDASVLRVTLSGEVQWRAST
jgi:hypothetical protein